jgi:hypothetical protein
LRFAFVWAGKLWPGIRGTQVFSLVRAYSSLRMRYRNTVIEGSSKNHFKNKKRKNYKILKIEKQNKNKIVFATVCYF